MRGLKTWAWAAVFTAASAAPVAAQGGISGGGQPPGGVGLGGGSGISGGLSSSGLAGGLATGRAGAGLGGGTGLGGGAMGGAAGQSTIPQLMAPTGQASTSLQSSNFLAGYYANPYFQGMITAPINAAPGGFGNALYPTTGGGGGLRGGGGLAGGGLAGGGLAGGGLAGGGRVGATGLGGGGFGNTGLGAGGVGNAANQSGIVVPLVAPLNYVAVVRNPAPRIAPARIQTEIRTTLDNTSLIPSAKSVQVVTDLNNNVTLRGTVADEVEAQLVEGVVRLTPGVGEIKNELTFTRGK